MVRIPIGQSADRNAAAVRMAERRLEDLLLLLPSLAP